MTVVPPLFIQTAGYDAAADRQLIGGVAWPGADQTNYPRPRWGVRPQGTNVDKKETSLLVSSAHSGTKVKINAGSAFVPGASAAGIDGVYFVVVPNDIEISAGAVNPGITTYRKIVLTVLDPMVTGSPAGTALWEIVGMDSTTTPPQCSIVLANVTISGTAGADLAITDIRQFTSTHGGMLLIGSKATDIDNQGALVNAPYGSIAYATGDKQPFLKNHRGWSRWPVNVLTDIVSPGDPTEGEVWFHGNNKTLHVYQGGKWEQLTNGPIPEVRRNYETSYTGLRIVNTPSRHMVIKCTGSANAYYEIASGYLVNVSGQPAKPTNPAELEARVKINATSGLVAVTVSARVYVKDAAGNYGGLASIAIERYSMSQWANSGDVNWQDNIDPTDEVAPTATLSWEAGHANVGVDWGAGSEQVKTRTAHFNCSKGEHVFRPVFGVSAQNSTMEIAYLSMEVTTL